ncbi:RluA family pseudouridine synthase [Sphingorhabdus sp. Alg239-R122]|uniref:RluA family pseudouridine synthase n=1 Tax=Sphingorhabdus sp. Alg239-R122 TaxID=2305989 RepID=UPI0013DA7B31|nr:RluA family pseudouridine synthase [Sphingorhabdus sp. Alg239-R122]
MDVPVSKYEGTFLQSHAGQRIDSALADIIPDLSRERIKALIKDGRLSIDGQSVTQSSAKVRTDTHYCLGVPAPIAAKALPQDIPLNIVYEDEVLLVLDKPAGMVVHPAAGHADGTLVNALLHHCEGQLSGIGGVARPGIVHRIDKDTSGLLVAAKTDVAHVGLAEQFADHSVTRQYYAIVQGYPNPAKGTVTGNIGRSRRDRKKMAIVPDGQGKHAVTHYEMLEKLSEAALVRCQLETGRTHQVRVHMASIGHSLLGDPNYARTHKAHRALLKETGFARQALHAATLGFIHPTLDEEMFFESKIPADMQELLTHLCV